MRDGDQSCSHRTFFSLRISTWKCVFVCVRVCVCVCACECMLFYMCAFVCVRACKKNVLRNGTGEPAGFMGGVFP